jgi:hypothetical protein
MAYFIFKTFTTALIIAGISELSKRFSFLSALLAALPITSVLIFIWMYIEQKDVAKIATMSQEIFLLGYTFSGFFSYPSVFVKARSRILCSRWR